MLPKTDPNDVPSAQDAIDKVLDYLSLVSEPCTQCGNNKVAFGAAVCQLCYFLFHLPQGRFCGECYHSDPDNAVCPKCQDTLAEGLPDYDD